MSNSIDPREAYHCYRFGWADGAAARAMRKDIQEQSILELRGLYLEGYTDGYQARKEAMHKKAEMLGYEPLILRTQAEEQDK